MEVMPHTGGDLDVLQSGYNMEEYQDLLHVHGLEDNSCLPEAGGRRSWVVRTSMDPVKPPQCESAG